MKTYSGVKIEFVKKKRSQRSSSFDFLISFVSTLWLSSLWLPRLANVGWGKGRRFTLSPLHSGFDFVCRSLCDCVALPCLSMPCLALPCLVLSCLSSLVSPRLALTLPCFALPFAVGIMAKKVRGHQKDNSAKGRQSAKERNGRRLARGARNEK